jgi:MATE family multidrug resistance protein
MMISNACGTVMTFTNRLFLAKLGSSQMNAALAGGISSFMLTTFFIGMIGYGTALIGQYYGAKQKSNCALVVTQSVILALVAYPIILCFIPVMGRLFSASGIAREQLEPQMLYFKILATASILDLIRQAYSCFFTGIGRTKTVLAASLVTMLINVIGSYCLVLGKFGFPEMGIRGAAYSTILGGLSGVIILVCAYYFGNKRDEYDIAGSMRFDKEIMLKLIKFGYPAGLEFLLGIAAFSAMIFLFQMQGQAAATAATITFNWDMVAFVPLIGIEIAVTSLVGRYKGAEQPDTAHRATMSGIKVGTIYSAVMVVLFAAFPGPLIELFRPDTNDAVFQNAIPLTTFMIRLMAFYVLFEATICAFAGALRGAGDTLWAMGISVILHWLMVALLAYLFIVCHASVQVGWVAIVLWMIPLISVFYLRYRSGKWRTIKVINQAPVVFEPDAVV